MPSFTRIKFPGVSMPGTLPALGVAWTPAELGAAVIGWWDAAETDSFTLDGANVTGWESKAAGGLTLVPPAAYYPTYDAAGWATGQAGVVFPGNASISTGAMLNVAGGVYEELEVFVLAARGEQSDDASSGARVVAMLPVVDQGGGLGKIGYGYVSRPSSEPAQNSWAGAGIGSGATGHAVTSWVNGGKTVAQLTMSSAGVVPRLAGGTPASAGNLGASTTGYWQFGGHLSNKKAWAGAIRQIVVCNGILSDANRQKVEGYLAWTGGAETVAALPSGHPYKAAGPVL